MDLLELKYNAFGLDINDSSIKIVKLEKRRGAFRVVSYGKTNLKPGTVQAGVIKDEKTLIGAIKTACANVTGKRLKAKYVFISLPEEESFLQVIQMPKMSANELKSAVVFEAENYIPLPVEDVYLDFQPVLLSKEDSSHSDVLVVATPKKIVDSYVSCVKSAGLIPVCAEVESQSVVRALIKNGTNEEPVVLADIGQDSVDFIVFSGRSIRFTGSIQISQDELEKAMDSKKSSFISQIKKYIDFYQEHASREHLPQDGEIKKIMLCGGGAGIKGVADFIAKGTGVPVEIGNPLINSITVKEAKKADFLPYTTAIGLALGAVKIEKENLYL